MATARPGISMFSIIRLITMTGLPRLIVKLALDRRVPLMTKLILPFAVVYFVSPIDLFPDFILPYGRLDDLLALVAAPLLFIGLSPRAVVLEHMGRGPADEDDAPMVETTARQVDDKPDPDQEVG